MKAIERNVGNAAAMRLALIWMFAGGLLAAMAPAAHAHDYGHHGTHYAGKAHARIYAPKYPSWLKKHKAFKEWYLHSAHYRLAAGRHYRYVDWHRLYDLYLIDRYHALQSEGHRRHHDRDGYRAHSHGARPPVHRHGGD